MILLRQALVRIILPYDPRKTTFPTIRRFQVLLPWFSPDVILLRQIFSLEK
jgi:hypothetical protein